MVHFLASQSSLLNDNKYLRIPLLDPNDDPIIFQGELLKLKPGVKFDFQPRWIQVTGRSLRYYKSRWTQNNGLVKPLGAIPVEAIERIKILETDVTRIHASCQKKSQFNFEIILKEDFLDLYLNPYYDVCLSEDKQSLGITITKRKNELQHFQQQHEHIDYYSDPIRKEL